MKKYAIPLALSALVLVGITACKRSDSASTAPQTDSTQTNAPASSQDNSQAKAYQTTERSKKREAVRKQVEAVLTQDQVQQLETKLQQGEKMRQALSEINLTADQKTNVQDILKTAYTNRQKSEQQSPQ